MIKKLLKLIRIGLSIDNWFYFLPLEKKTQIYNWYTTHDNLETLARSFQKECPFYGAYQK